MLCASSFGFDKFVNSGSYCIYSLFITQIQHIYQFVNSKYLFLVIYCVVQDKK